MDEHLYVMTVSTRINGAELLRITGTRATVIETALRVMVDFAPAWDPRSSYPQFDVTVHKVAAR